MTTERRCTECGETKPFTPEFFRTDNRLVHATVRGGRCRACLNRRERARKQETRARRVTSVAAPTPSPRVAAYGSPVTSIPSIPPGPIPLEPIDDTEVTAPGGQPRMEPPTALPRTAHRRYVITCAQNATGVHAEFWATLQTYARIRQADIVVIPTRYRNPTSFWGQQQDHDEWWAHELAPHLFAGHAQLASSNVAIAGNVPIAMTAPQPLASLADYAAPASLVLGHPTIAFETHPSPSPDQWPRIHATTGAVTMPNYTDTKAGRLAESRHQLGAIVLEIEADGHHFHLRHVRAAADGSFDDLMWHYTTEGRERAARPLAFAAGDTHVEHLDETMKEVTWSGPASIARTLRPELCLTHDTLDFDRALHHTRHRFTDRFERRHGLAPASIEEEVVAAVRFVEDVIPEDLTAAVVVSNHDTAFDRWLFESDPREDVLNVDFWCVMMGAACAARRTEGRWVPALELAHKIYGRGRPVLFVDSRRPLQRGGVWLHHHGHLGPNGSRGSRQAFTRLGEKVIIGHSHTPGIRGHVTQTGTSAREQGYNLDAPSSHMETHAILYATGATTLVTIVRKPDGTATWRDPEDLDLDVDLDASDRWASTADHAAATPQGD